MMLKTKVIFGDDILEVEYPAQYLSYYAGDIEIDMAGAWVNYCDHDGNTVMYYNALTKERTWV